MGPGRRVPKNGGQQVASLVGITPYKLCKMSLFIELENKITKLDQLLNS